MTEPPPCANGCDQPDTWQTPRHTKRGVFYVWLCDDCTAVREDVIEERRKEWWT